MPFASTRGRETLGYQSFPRAGGAIIDINNDGVEIRITYHHNRSWSLVIGFGLVTLAATALIVYDSLAHRRWSSPLIIAAAVLFALLAMAAAIRGSTPPLYLIANSRGLRMRGGVLNETLDWRREEILGISAQDLEIPHTKNRRISIVAEFRHDEYVTFPVATKQEQAAILQALQGALKLPPATKD